MSEKSAVQLRYEHAQDNFHRASLEFEAAIRAYIEERVKNYYPQATGIALFGTFGSDNNFRLRVTGVKVGSVLLNIDDEAEPVNPNAPRTKFESVANEIADDLDWLTDLTGGFYQTSGELDFQIIVTKEKK